MKTHHLLALGFASVCALLAGCATQIKSDVTQNPAPAAKFSNYAKIEMKPIRLQAAYAGQEANEAAMKKIQSSLDAKMQLKLADWNDYPPQGSSGTLVIEPVIEEIKFIAGGARFWAGAMAGSSAVRMKVKISEQESGRQIAYPEFYARAAAMSGAYSFGAADNAMLTRVAGRLADYLMANYDEAVGGPSGAEPGR